MIERRLIIRPGEMIAVNGVWIRAAPGNTAELWVAASADDLQVEEPPPAAEPDGADEPVIYEDEGW